ncbi:hypothetical protein LOZ12_004695 [Ophidiomyces ophidiicola]|uniref:Uncharacterized protein n=1 Tax=Ophidiomyces ophidiicola TaxID=1387563 RepID=A0ACB8US89_9EURO|nr:uncharacterized protein LOZ57_006517 [Ophidiomyces ophidiicola]KAI1910328.1 hypothetical protein LOZ64_005003 [Ophidiomyces ophidiicola]KAI1913747.1 hypothetical protein LOZ61_002633 [Ophidiomyces ophidiicola]KAI1928628.1 hypothetical protein LOZ60_002177 [Ophidiomyces ophidiicola]KAI1937836.1 hypothetical protein LOZ57_006517 [Ophidiomyces ophidiicola]KAI1942370.1 hypothetical protein LOZ62_004591 [Ophidiomyces ophidiicola]
MMSNYSDSDVDDEMACRCSYCGRFCSRANIHELSGLCFPCEHKLHPSKLLPEDENENPEADEIAINANESESWGGASVASKAEGKESGSQESGSHPQGFGEPNQPAESALCARCWTRSPTRVLYNSPTCDECFQEAKVKKEGSRGTKRRFQPPTPLQPGKKLTRVCDSCRQKRKRCEHRRVVDADDPAATDRRRKRVKVEAPVPESDEPEDTLETGDAIATDADANPSIVPVVEKPAVNNCGSAEENLQWAIKQSVQTVYRREMERLVEVAEAKAAEANQAFEVVKQHVSWWLAELMRPSS